MRFVFRAIRKTTSHMNGWRGGATRFLSGRAVQRQSATSMTNDGSKRGVRMTGPQRVMI